MSEDAAENKIATSGLQAFALVAGCFFVSGFAALLYETVWLRQFAILLGTSERALAVVLASYMGGLAIGSLVASRVVNRITRPLLTYGLLELGIAVTALLLPYGLAVAESMQVSILGGVAEPPDSGGWLQTVFCFATAFGLILLPTGMMGATLPLLARHVVHNDHDVGTKIGLLYAINTAGAVAGTLAAAFALLPDFGLSGTTTIGALANLIVFLLVVVLVRSHGAGSAPHPAPPPKDDTRPVAKKSTPPKNRRKSKGSPKSVSKENTPPVTSTPRYQWMLLLIALSGSVSFCYEIVFTRMLGHLLGGSVYAFATMLSGFLLGISFGGVVASRLATTRYRAAVGFVYAQATAAICTLVAFQSISSMMNHDWSAIESGRQFKQVVWSIAILLPTASCIGLTFPFAIRAYAKNEHEAARGAAKVYGWNVVGGIAGALLTAGILLQTLQYHGSTTLSVALNILLATSAVVAIGIKRIHLAGPCAAIAVLIAIIPTSPESVLRISSLTGTQTAGDIVFNHVGKSATVTVFYDAQGIKFQTNGLPESTLPIIGSGQIHRNNGTWLSALPPLVRPGIESMLVIGLGGGVAVESVAPSVQSIDVMELEPAVIDANQTIAPFRDADPLADARVNLIVNDGRNALSLTDKKYDAIVSQPSHPWTSGASHLYTREFNQLVREHLNPGGIFLQWMNTDFVDLELTRSMGATLLDVFPHVRLYQPFGGTFMFVASDEPIRPEAVSNEDGVRPRCQVMEVDRAYFHRLGIATPTHLFALLTLDEAGMRRVCSNATLITDEKNLLAMRAPQLLGRHDGQNVQASLEKESPILQSVDNLPQLCPSLELRPYSIQKISRSPTELMRTALPKLFPNQKMPALVQAQLDRAAGDSEAWTQTLVDAISETPNDADLAFVLLANKALGRQFPLNESATSQLRNNLTEAHRKLVRLLEEAMRGEPQNARSVDDELAAVDVDDVAFEMAVRLRLPWRLESTGPERRTRGLEVVQIIDDSAAFADSDGLAFFRASGALQGDQPLVAIGTILQLITSIESSAPNIDRSSIANFGRCYQLLQGKVPFARVERQHRDATERAESLLRRLQ